MTWRRPTPGTVDGERAWRRKVEADIANLQRVRNAPVPSLTASPGGGGTFVPLGGTKVTSAIAERPAASTGEVYVDRTFSFNWDGTSPVLLAGDSGGTSTLTVDDEIVVDVTHADASTATFTHTFSGGALDPPDPAGPFDLSAYFEAGVNTVRVRCRDVYGGSVESTEVWLTGSVFGLDDLSDVDTSTTPPTGGQALVFDSVSGLWGPQTVGGGGSGQLLAVAQHSPATRNDLTASSTIAAIDTTNLRVSFTVPASGQVVLSLAAMVSIDSTQTVLSWGVLSGASAVTASFASVGFRNVTAGQFQYRVTHRALITGLTAGASAVWDFAHFRSFGTGTVKTCRGGSPTTAGDPGPATMEVWSA